PWGSSGLPNILEQDGQQAVSGLVWAAARGADVLPGAAHRRLATNSIAPLLHGAPQSAMPPATQLPIAYATPHAEVRQIYMTAHPLSIRQQPCVRAKGGASSVSILDGRVPDQPSNRGVIWAHSASSPAWSSASKRAGLGLSKSNTPKSWPPWISGTTISDADAASHAI
ncbi:MAG: hypothetical protein RLZ59_474, partial [Pseudomonadota bacterium]